MSEDTSNPAGGRPIVVGVDGSPSSAAALDWVVAQSEALRRPVRAVSAWHFVPMAAGPATVLVDPDNLRQEHIDRLHEMVAEAKQQAVGEIDIRQEVIEGPPATVLLDASRDAAVLVLGSHGHGRAYSSIVGSVSAACIRHARCPVIVIPPGAAEEMETNRSRLVSETGP
ncbi:universal stress protein [Actinoalloteichus hymeniacidonis]|uniref:Universal stress protein UspA-like protein n=1 Tax=Actinoalloteichus hymeniacidonis TaxID=340345 RepID=A0AAC9HP23_9PSEU|nr:universal stress protein [Actinoalloteichus hymeniacidonis]AOS62830.1 universal stress protein UspA-like protein [Actinoalloteichus hymeniacidonis]MBB5909138.1 nucleotide-binding universal stress UspA family protein [Actinoalloteichus hymeniacidonis]